MAKAETGGSDPAQRERRKQAAEEKKRVEQEQEAERRKQLLAQAESAVAAQQEALTNARVRSRALAALVSHTEGFYDEIDKLAKGKALFAATDLAVQQVNDIIRDAKAIIEGDPHLNRVKEFVPAGDNPVYPDILLATRAVQQCGSGVGTYMAGLIVDTVANSPGLQQRGVRHVEEMQLLAAGIGPDRVSDIAANLLKRFLVEYTQRQAAIWKIPLRSGVPIHHVYEHQSREWVDTHADLPVDDSDPEGVRCPGRCDATRRIERRRRGARPSGRHAHLAA